MNNISEKRSVKANADLHTIAEELFSTVENYLIRHYHNFNYINLIKYNSELFVKTPNHLMLHLLSANSATSNMIPYDETFIISNTLQQGDNEDHLYTTMSRIYLNDVVINPIKINTKILNIPLIRTLKNDNLTYIDLWLNPNTSELSLYELYHIKQRLITSTVLIVISPSSPQEQQIQCSIEDISYSIQENIVLMTRVQSPSLFLGMRISIQKHDYNNITKNKESINIKFFHNINSDLIPKMTASGNLFLTNIIPIFNLFDDYTRNETCTMTTHVIPILHRTLKNVSPVGINRLWIDGSISTVHQFESTHRYVFDPFTRKILVNGDEYNRISNYPGTKKIQMNARWENSAPIFNDFNITSNSIRSSNIPYIVLRKSERPESKWGQDKYIDFIQDFRNASLNHFKHIEYIQKVASFLCRSHSTENTIFSDIIDFKTHFDDSSIIFSIKSKNIYRTQYYFDIIRQFIQMNALSNINIMTEIG